VLKILSKYVVASFGGKIWKWNRKQTKNQIYF